MIPLEREKVLKLKNPWSEKEREERKRIVRKRDKMSLSEKRRKIPFHYIFIQPFFPPLTTIKFSFSDRGREKEAGREKRKRELAVNIHSLSTPLNRKVGRNSVHRFVNY